MAVVRHEDGRLLLGGVDLATLGIPTPAYVYDLSGMQRAARALVASFEGAPHQVAYAIKANSAGPVVRALHAAGCGADVVSGAELGLALACGVPARKVLFSGVAKSDGEIERAIVAGIGAIQLESVEEIARVEARARTLAGHARVSLRMNPATSLETLATHVHIATGHDEAKFGIAKDDLPAALARIRSSPDLSLVGLSTHVGSQLTETRGYLEAARSLFEVVKDLRGEHGRNLELVDTGGGFGVDYGEGCSASPADFVRETRSLMAAFGLSDLTLAVEPGRSLVAAQGVLLTRVLQQKLSPHGGARDARQRWLMVDAGMNDLLRPALYQARHRVVIADREAAAAPRLPFRVVGPVCESSDDFGAHELAVPSSGPPPLLAILDAGAYGYTMASEYNGRALPSEVFLEDGRVVLVRRRRDESAWIEERLRGAVPP